ncbi:hypothetical protein DFP72DRAFT_875881 [Ephemerocybe angulata]|uniref:F-box domain-containing protein n=1 Tax=Ephemerocybe angulata TaxID=980116 RepID=A0A8H6MFM4_9AGAR|nr:hypothetical protein DFP72DRAFT_875881 [Tulosesus angulatus]
MTTHTDWKMHNLKDYEEAALQRAIAPIAKLSSPLNFADPEAVIQAQIYICRGLLSAIRRIPSEILRDIFEYCVELPIPEWVECGKKAGPFDLCLVCRALKDAANNHPPLWSTPRVHHGQRFLQVTEAHATAMKNWVPRICAYPWAARIDVESWKEAKKRHRQTRKKYPLHPNGSPLYISSPRRPIKTSFGCMCIDGSPTIETGLGGWHSRI